MLVDTSLSSVMSLCPRYSSGDSTTGTRSRGKSAQTDTANDGVPTSCPAPTPPTSPYCSHKCLHSVLAQAQLLLRTVQQVQQECVQHLWTHFRQTTVVDALSRVSVNHCLQQLWQLRFQMGFCWR